LTIHPIQNAQSNDVGVFQPERRSSDRNMGLFVRGFSLMPGELIEHLGYGKHHPAGMNTGTSDAESVQLMSLTVSGK
jgi:hypothetical protein